MVCLCAVALHDRHVWAHLATSQSCISFSVGATNRHILILVYPLRCTFPYVFIIMNHATLNLITPFILFTEKYE